MSDIDSHPGLGRYPLSRPQRVDQLPPGGIPVQFSATPSECKALSQVLDILGVASLDAQLRVKPWRKTGVLVEGHVSARATQACVVTLEPVDEVVEEDVHIIFLPQGAYEAAMSEPELDPLTDDLPDLLTGPTIDLGDLAAEHLALGLNPYPRAPEAEFEPIIEDDGSNDKPVSPFAALKIALEKDK